MMSHIKDRMMIKMTKMVNVAKIELKRIAKDKEKEK